MLPKISFITIIATKAKQSDIVPLGNVCSLQSRNSLSFSKEDVVLQRVRWRVIRLMVIGDVLAHKNNVKKNILLFITNWTGRK